MEELTGGDVGALEAARRRQDTEATNWLQRWHRRYGSARVRQQDGRSDPALHVSHEALRSLDERLGSCRVSWTRFMRWARQNSTPAGVLLDPSPRLEGGLHPWCGYDGLNWPHLEAL